MIKKILILLTLLYAGVSFSQDTVLMPQWGHKDTTASYLAVYDDGGKDGVHSSRCDASYTFHTVNPDGKFYINVNSKLTHGNQGLASLKIMDGEDDNGFYIFNEYWEIKGVYYSTGNSVTVVFKADDDDPTEGFEISLEECSLAAPEDVTWEQIDSTTIKLSWTEVDTTTHWIIDYTQINFSTWNNPSVDFAYDENYLTAYSDTNYVLLTDLQPHQWLSYNVYGQTSDGLIGCGGFAGYCPCLYPENMVITHDKDSLYFHWDEPDTSVIWSFHIWGNGFEEYHHLTENYWSYPLSCSEKLHQAYIAGNCDVYTDYFGANNWCEHRWLAAGDLQLTCPNVAYVRPRAIDNNSITVMWTEIDTVDTYIVGYRQADMTEDDIILYDTFSIGANVCTIEGLEENTSYIITVYTLCNDGELSCGTEEWITTTFENCLDFTNLIAPKTYLTWGDYDNPQADLHVNNYRLGDGSVEDGSNDWFWGSDRHVVKNDTNEYDYNTGNKLRCVPEGELASVRLGNDYVERQAESISYEYTVDSNDKDMLVLKYAVVMQDPEHTKENQPRFTLEILDENNQVIDTTCCFADFYAAGDLGWNEVEGAATRTIWKDWTTIGIDIAPYHGQTIHVRLTTYDCDEGGHYGYAYFNIKCDNKKIYVFNRCDGEDSIWLQAPLGFDYYWHRVGKTDTLSKTFEVKVPIDDNVYECVASFVGKPSCNFTMSTIPVAVNPVADANYVVDTCNSKVIFINSSYLNFDTTQGVYTRQFVDSVWWILDDGTEALTDTVERFYTENGLYNVQLCSRLWGSDCIDTLNIPLNINFNIKAQINGADNVCPGDTVRLVAAVQDYPGVSYKWNTGATTPFIDVVPMGDDTLYTLDISLNGQCGGKAYKSITLNESYNDTVYAQLCYGEVFDSLNFKEKETGIYTKHYQSVTGCDSISVLNLTINPHYNIELYDTICDGEVYKENGFEEDASGVYVHALTTSAGCDSVVSLYLTVNSSYDTLITASVCRGVSYTDNNFEEHHTGEYVQYHKTEYGCDSIVRLNLTVNEVYDTTIVANICRGTVYDENGFNENETGIYIKNLQSEYGCDSTVTLNLNMRSHYHDTIYAIGCDEGYDDYGFTVEETGFYIQTLESMFGCDSIVNLDFKRIHQTVDTLHEEIFKDETYAENDFEESSTGIYTNVYQDQYGCDSTIVLDLLVVDLKFQKVITPNGDGINDIFEIDGLLEQTIYEENTLIVYNRYGYSIYKKDNINSKEDFWDPAKTNTPDGTYFFRFTAKSKRRTLDFTGSVEVLR